MEQPTVEEFALCAVASLFSAVVAPAFLLDFTAAYIIYYTSQSNSGVGTSQNKIKHFGVIHSEQTLIVSSFFLTGIKFSGNNIHQSIHKH